MKLLKCQYHGGEWDGQKVVSLPIKDLWASVPVAEVWRGKKFFGPLLEDIRDNGLRFPLLIVEATEAQLKEQKAKYKDKILPLPEIKNNHIYVVWGGSNRLKIAEQLGFTHVDCVLFPRGGFKAAYAKQRLHRQPYRETYYS